MNACAKVRYGTRRTAKRAARSDLPPVPRLTAYQCRECGFWHLTSQTTARKTWFRAHGGN